MQEAFLNYYFLKYFEFWISKTWGRVAVVCFLIWKWIQSANLIWFLIICLSLKNIFRGIRNSQAACGILWQLIVFKRISSVSSLDLVHKVCLFIPALSFPLIFFFFVCLNCSSSISPGFLYLISLILSECWFLEAILETTFLLQSFYCVVASPHRCGIRILLKYVF